MYRRHSTAPSDLHLLWFSFGIGYLLQVSLIDPLFKADSIVKTVINCSMFPRQDELADAIEQMLFTCDQAVCRRSHGQPKLFQGKAGKGVFFPLLGTFPAFCCPGPERPGKARKGGFLSALRKVSGFPLSGFGKARKGGFFSALRKVSGFPLSGAWKGPERTTFRILLLILYPSF